MTMTTSPAPGEPSAAQVPALNIPQAETPAPEPVQAESEQVQSEPKSDEPEQKKKASVSERIGQLTAQRRAAEADAQFARREADRLRADLAKMRTTPTEELPFEQQQAAQVRQSIKEERFEETVAAAYRAEEAALEIRAKTFEAKVETVRERIPDFDQVVNGSVPISDFAADLIAESEKAPEIAYWLGKNLAEAERISRLPPHKQGAEIARIEARVTVPSRKLTTAPRPTPQVGGGSSPGAKDPAEMSMSEYAAWRKGKAA